MLREGANWQREGGLVTVVDVVLTRSVEMLTVPISLFSPTHTVVFVLQSSHSQTAAPSGLATLDSPHLPAALEDVIQDLVESAGMANTALLRCVTTSLNPSA